MDKIMCIYCGKKEVIRTIYPDGKNYFDVACVDCKQKIQMKLGICCYCSKKLEHLALICEDCRAKENQAKQRARAEGICSECFKRPIAKDLINIAGQKADICKECAEKSTKMMLIHSLNDAINRPEFFKEIQKDISATIKATRKKIEDEKNDR